MIEQEIIKSLGKEMQEAMDFGIVADPAYTVYVKLTNDQWNWLCDNVGIPQKDWVVRKGAVWFKQEQHRTLYVLRWA